MAEKDIVIVGFNYEKVSADEKGKLINYAGQYRRCSAKAAECLLEAGEILSNAQAVLANHKNGVFISWMELECGISKDSGYRAIRVFSTFSQEKYCRNLRQYIDRFEVSALYELTAPESSEPLENAGKIIEQGGRISYSDARKIRKEWQDSQNCEQQESEPEHAGPDLSDEVRQRHEIGEFKATKGQLEQLAEYDHETQELLVESVVEGVQSLKKAIETGEIPEPSIEEVGADEAKEIESFCRKLTKFFKDECPDTPWMEVEDLRNSAMSHIKSACQTLRLAKAETLCPECSGDGCHVCKEIGRITKTVKDQLQ